jgi:hypothetical protein
MFPDPVGERIEQAVLAGADSAIVVPDDFVLVRGGVSDMPPPWTTFSASTGPTVESASAALPHGTIRIARVADVRLAGGKVEWHPETTRYGTINRQHVNVTETGPTVFSDPRPNQVPSASRIDGDRRKK